MCDKGFIWNPSNCECECDKLYNVGEYLDYKNCKCRKRLIDKLVDGCNESIDGNKMLHNETLNVIPLDVIPLNVYKKVCSSRKIYVVLFDPSQIKIDKKSYKNISIYHNGYITIKRISDYENINSVNPLYLIIGDADGNKHFHYLRLIS